MRKWITYILVLSMIFSLTGCWWRNSTGTTGPTGTTGTTVPKAEYSLQDLLLYHATELASQVATTAAGTHTPGLQGEVAAAAQIFRVASTANAISSASFLVTDPNSLPANIASLNVSLLNAKQQDCTAYLHTYTQFYSPLKLNQKAAVYLRYNQHCHFIVLFEPQANQLVTATIYPLFSIVATAFLDTYCPNLSDIRTASVLEARERVADVSFVAKPTGGGVEAGYYSSLANFILAETAVLTKDELAQYTSNLQVLNNINTFAKTLTHKPVSCAGVYTFPSDLESQISSIESPRAQQQVRQQLYLSWSNGLSEGYGETCTLANTILRNVMRCQGLGAVHAESEEPVIVVLDFVICTALVTIYPNEYNTYLTSITCLPCTCSDAVALLTGNGAERMQ